MGLEIEHKFLVKGEFKPFARSNMHIIQGYICYEPARTVRVRIRDEEGFLTIKGPSEKYGLQRYEFEKKISLSEARDLLQLCLPGVVDKYRYLVPFAGHIFEVDEFYGENEGLVMAELELGSIEETFDKPDFLWHEVTGDKRFYNAQLVQHPFREWGPEFLKTLL